MFKVKSVRAEINIPRAIRRIDNDALWTFAASEWNRLINPFVPMDTGALSQNTTIMPKKIRYEEDYGVKVYSSNANFRKDQHPLATKEWDKAAAPSQKGKLIAALKDYIKQRGLLNG